ncbi:MAG: radical SAM protein [Candidatus Undinarchaeales archaeon]|nr:radical SAM protein [Candidatus Undinarchaeales archaeon]MDP7493083.1 radical SAM protein [Candidatus Undinarchaeales archaeon]
MRVLLLAPRVSDGESTLPLGLAYIAAVLEADGCEVFGRDLSFTGPEDVAREAADLGVDAVLASSLTSTLGQVAAACDMVRCATGAPVALGGPHATALPAHALGAGDFDALMVGEGEDRVVPLVRALTGNGRLARVPGLLLPGGISTGPAPLPPDPDSLPYPRREAFPESLYSGMPARGPYTPLVTSRGCRRRCAHCPSHSLVGGPRRRSPANVADEVEHLLSRGYREFQVEDDGFAEDRGHVVGICDAFRERGLDIDWACTNGLHPDDLDEGLLAALAETGCYSIALGIESLDRSVLATLCRPMDLERIAGLVRAAHDHGMEVSGYFMLGLPGTVLNDGGLLADEALALDLDTAHFSVFSPLPGSPIFSRLIAEGASVDELVAGNVPGMDRIALDAESARAYRRFYAGRKGVAVVHQALSTGRPFEPLVKKFKGWFL